MITNTLSSLFILALGFTAFNVSAEVDTKEAKTELEGMSVMGSNYQPQVLYIVPWQPPSYQKRAQHLPNTILSGIIKPLEPSFHKEDFHFRKKLEVKVQALNSN
jgi:hypothetical protein